MLSDLESNAIEEVLTLLYCCPSFQDFKKPVEILYPALWEQYQNTIDVPMDLGNLLLKSRRGLLKVNELREHLQLVSSNCIKFNGNASIMVNIANHYLSYATALFEEIMNLPFKDTSQPFEVRKLVNRIERYEYVKSEPLNNRELKRLREVLLDLSPPSALKSVVQQVVSTVSQILIENAEVTEDSSGHLWDILLPLVQSTTSASDKSDGRDTAFVPANCKVHKDYQAYAKLLDDELGVLTAMMQERLLRGNTYSTRWLRPYNFVVWAQPPKDGKGRAPWWPAFIVASASKLFPMNPELCQINLARITDDVKTQLYKLRPRGNQHTSGSIENGESGSGDAVSNTALDESKTAAAPSRAAKAAAVAAAAKSDFVVPEGYLLIEFFGSHDFGWIKAELCGVFKVEETDDGQFKHSPPPAAPVVSSANGATAGGSGSAAPKTCSAEIIKEALNAAVYLEDLVLTAGEAIAEDLDQPVPTLSELEDSLRVNESFQGLTMLSARPASRNGHSESVKQNVSNSSSKRKSPVDKTMVEESRKKTKFSATEDSSGLASRVSIDVDTSKYSVSNYPGMGSVINHFSLPLDELNRSIVNNVFKVSKCSLPTRQGVLLTSLTVTTTTDCESMETANLTSSSKLGGAGGKRRFYKENAIHRCKAISYWMERVRPLNFSHYTVTKQNQATLAIAVKNNLGHSPSTSSHGASGASNVTSMDDLKDPAVGTTTVITDATDYWNENIEEEKPAKSSSSILERMKAVSAAKQEKRKYVFKHNKPAVTEKTVDIGAFKKNTGDEEGTSKRVYTGTHLTSSGTNCFNLESGSSRYFVGDGSVYTRRVKLDSDVFFLESKSREIRKAILRDELAFIAQCYKNIQEISVQRLQDEALHRTSSKRSALPQDSDSEHSEDESNSDEEDEEEEEEGSSEEEEEPTKPHIQQAINARLQNIVSPVKNLPGKVGLIRQLELQRQQQLASKAPVSISNMLPI